MPRPLLFSHPVYAYLERRYALFGRSLHWEPDELPDEREWESLTAFLEEQLGAWSWIVFEDEPLAETKQRLTELGVRSVVVSPCANTPEAGDFLSVMKDNASRLEAALRPPRWSPRGRGQFRTLEP
jgi:zinc transport system substrate-binding protein